MDAERPSARKHVILICGAGAVGTILATHLAAAGREVALYARPKDVERFACVSQLRVEPARAGHPVISARRPPLVTTLDLEAVDALVICVKYPDLAALIAQLPVSIPDGCTLVSTLNGVAPLRLLRERFPIARIVPMSVMLNGQLLGPLHTRLKTRAEIVLGTLDTRVLKCFTGIGLNVKRADGDTAVWGKLLINLANAICALTRSPYKDALQEPHLRRIYVATLDEATAALNASGIAWKLPLVVPYRCIAGRSCTAGGFRGGSPSCEMASAKPRIRRWSRMSRPVASPRSSNSTARSFGLAPRTASRRR